MLERRVEMRAERNVRAIRSTGFGAPGRRGPSSTRKGGVLSGLLLLGAGACESKTVLLGRGQADAGQQESWTSSSVETTASSGASGPVPSASSLDTLGRACDESYSDCLEQQGGSMCTSMLIYCRIAPADGGVLTCDQVRASCQALGYTEPECEGAVTICEEGEVFSIVPASDATTSSDSSGL